MEKDFSNLGFKTLNTLGFGFKGVFQCRLATDSDPSLETRGINGWTFAYDDEPDLDRVIKFNNPLSPRSFVPNVGVIVTYAMINNRQVDDSIAGQAVNLGSNSFFDGTNGADGHEPIMDFEFHVGNNNSEYIFGIPSNPPKGGGTHGTSLPLPISLQALINSRMNSLSGSSKKVDVERLQNIRKSLWEIYNVEVSYTMLLDKDIKYNPMDSKIVKLMEQKNITNLNLDMDFYGYDGDGLVGYVNGTLSGQYR